ncbi:helix-turn-helix domain-containing protein [Nocardioides sp. dk4132]|uniref:helix-turn-helix domain-containing protein n=1 Tax=unclassified Nocardioides TaxID=2615069 RepID=UPI0012967FE1|nr:MULTISPECIES: helix-turn-helix domain-containing protein [unclassified Nocardioides]MQW76401.1 helix-turn-helix domain-containing protein [Nocardioides sp. dk4132]QGA07325.1 helix-turn-helix domain-containing protein [Nocardioides sp. dk884]
MLTNVAVITYDGITAFELGVACEAFGSDRSDDGLPVLDFALCAAVPGPVRTGAGFTISVDHDLERVTRADLVVALPTEGLAQSVPPPVLEALRTAHDRGARLMSMCTGAFVLGEAGLLDDRECTTHWRYTEELSRRFPRARVVPEVLHVDSGRVVTSAGTAASIDASLHIWRQEHGSAVAATIARRMVVPPQRDGGQAQFIERPVPDLREETFGALQQWALDNLHLELDVATLAHRTLMSPRTFARRFRAEVGATPHAWVTAQRVLRAEQLLERTDHTIDRIAADVGFGNAANLRLHLTRARGLSPQQYRRRFAC